MQYRIMPFFCDVFFMNPFRSCFFCCETTVFRLHAWGNALLHGIAAAFDVSNYRLAFLMMSLYSSSLGSIELTHQFSGVLGGLLAAQAHASQESSDPPRPSQSSTRPSIVSPLRDRTSVTRIMCSLSRVTSAGDSKVFLPSGAAVVNPVEHPGAQALEVNQAALHAPPPLCPPLVQHVEEPVAHDGVVNFPFQWRVFDHWFFFRFWCSFLVGLLEFCGECPMLWLLGRFSTRSQSDLQLFLCNSPKV